MTAFQFKEPVRFDLSIIIVSFNTRDVLLDCLTSVDLKTEGISYEVIVVDNASEDQSCLKNKVHSFDADLLLNQKNM